MTAELSPSVVSDERIIHRDSLRGGQAWSRRLRRHEVLRIVDLTGKACVSALFYNARHPLERYNMPDTLKAQFTAFLTRGRVLYSDMGRVLCSVIGDTCGWHDTLSGCGDAVSSKAKFGDGGYQELRNEFHRNARDNFLVELAKHGLGKRDVVPNVNFFVRVVADAEGNLAWKGDNSHAGAWVDLRFEMDSLVVLTNTPHPLDPATRYAPQPIGLVVWQGDSATADDECRQSRPENGRGFALTEAYALEMSETAPARGRAS
jgi:urea carboxylase-associated protein 2